MSNNFNESELVKKVSESTYLLCLPDACKAGKWEAALYFSQGIEELRKKIPRKKFRFVPFGTSENGVNSMLAIMD